MKYTFKKEERLKSRKLIERLFVEGKRLKSAAVQMVYLQIEHDSDTLFQASFSVSKKRFKKAVDRNRIKRLMREVYRLNKHQLTDSSGEIYTKKYVFMFIYIAKNMVSYEEVEQNMLQLLEKLKSNLK